MTKNVAVRSALVSALLAAWATAAIAQAVDEVEPNDPVASAQHLVFGSTKTVTVNGVIGSLSGPIANDVDFYSFEAHAGDVITVDIDGGMHADGTGVDTNVAIFGPYGSDPLYLLRQNEDAGYPLDAGSVSPYDARIDNFAVQTTGTYVIGVSAYPAEFIDVNTMTTDLLEFNSNGAYTLIISGVTPSIQQIGIEIKPGRHEVEPSDPRAKGTIPVALLSSAQFNALKVDQSTLRFGKTGTEQSLVRCEGHGRDVNRDGVRDLVCHFDNAKAGFSAGDTEAILTGASASGMPFEGHGWLKVIARKRYWFHRDAVHDGESRESRAHHGSGRRSDGDE